MLCKDCKWWGPSFDDDIKASPFFITAYCANPLSVSSSELNGACVCVHDSLKPLEKPPPFASLQCGEDFGCIHFTLKDPFPCPAKSDSE